MKTLVIGYGNPLRGDDGLGVCAAQALVEMPLGEHVEVLACHQLTPELADDLSRVDRVVFVDADLDAAPGVLRCRALSPGVQTAAFSHQLDAQGLLALTQSLYGRRPEAHLVSLGVADMGLGEALSPPVREAMPTLLGRLLELLEGARSDRPLETNAADGGAAERAALWTKNL